MSHLKVFKDILEAQKSGCSTFMWVSRPLNMSIACKQIHRPSPNQHKLEVLTSPKIQELIEKISKEQNIPKGSVTEQVKAILNEIGFNMNIKTLRWLGLALTKICLRVTNGIFVNEPRIIKLKNLMGNTPVIYVPSHRSYADFILMSYVLFTYDIEIPAIAAGMDFHGMWGMGSMLRDTGAFFMRRSYNDDPLYWDTFKQYVYQLVTRGENGIEFFLEGTRSRTNKSLPPKFGLLSMILKAYFNADVPDILFCPINITYDRILEEKLFAFELLGVPKPKESTSGFFKSLSIIKENYGKYYINFGEVISAKEYFGKHAKRSVHNIKPKHLQTSTENERTLTSFLANDIVQAQQKLCIITTFNLIAIVASYNLLMQKKTSLKLLINEVAMLRNVLNYFGASVDSNRDVENDIKTSLAVHKNVLVLDQKNFLQIVSNIVLLDKKNQTKLKAHDLSEETMEFSVPFVMLQLYVNPVLHYLIDAVITANILVSCNKPSIDKDELFTQFHFLRVLFSKDFVVGNTNLLPHFDETLEIMLQIELIKKEENNIYLNTDNPLVKLLTFLLHPFLFAYVQLIYSIITFSEDICPEKEILTKTQAILEDILKHKQQFVHPYALSLDSMQNCLFSLQAMDCIVKVKTQSGSSYKPNRSKLEELYTDISKYLPNAPNVTLKNKL